MIKMRSSASDSATVETLTAEVRMLVVGTRQVTLSVARQLDWVHLSQLRVFGRVKLGRCEYAVIGSANDGSLAMAQYRPPEHVVWKDTEIGQEARRLHTAAARSPLIVLAGLK